MTPNDTEKARPPFFDDCEETPFMKACAERDRWRLRCMDADGKLAEQNELLTEAMAEVERLKNTNFEHDKRAGAHHKNGQRWKRELQEQSALLDLAVAALETNLNYLNWNADNLSGDDLIGDGMLTAKYKRQLSDIQDALTKITAARKTT